MQNQPAREESNEEITFMHEINLEKKTAKPEVISLLSEEMSVVSDQLAQENEDEEDNISDTNAKCFTADSLETIRSGESVFKVFTFDPEKCKANVDKCMAFWQKIDEMDLKPVNCSLYKPKKTEQPKEMREENDEVIEECESEIETQESKTSNEEIQISWCEALQELKKRKLDVVAKVAKPLRCKLCKALSFEPDVEDQPDNQHEEIVALNDWDPQKMRKTQKKLVQKDDWIPSKENVVDGVKQKVNTENVEIKIRVSKIRAKDEEIQQSTTETDLETKQSAVIKKDAVIKESKTKQDVLTKDAAIKESKIKQPVVMTKDDATRKSKSKQDVLTKDEATKESKTKQDVLTKDAAIKESKVKQPVVMTKDDATRKSKSKQDVPTKDDRNKESKMEDLKIKKSDAGTKELLIPTAEDEKTEEKMFMEEFESEIKTKESSLNLMENLFNEVLAKMSEEIDAHVNVKELVNEIITAAVEKIKAKKDKTAKTTEENQYKMPPYSKTGKYPCVCNEFACSCDTQQQKTTVEVIKSAKTEKKRNRSKQLKSISTQFPEELQAIVASFPDPIKGGFCKICGLSECVCKYIQENSKSGLFTHNFSDN